jgi:hypothetical protein
MTVRAPSIPARTRAGTPDAGAKQRATKCFADRIGNHQTVVSRRTGFAVLLEDFNQPGREQDRAPSGGALGKGFEAGLSAHLDDGADYAESPLIEVKRVGAEAGCLAPSKSRATGSSPDRPVSVGHHWKQNGHQLLARDDPFNRLCTVELRTAAVSW